MFYTTDTTALTGLPAPTSAPVSDLVDLSPLAGFNLWSSITACIRPTPSTFALGLRQMTKPFPQPHFQAAPATGAAEDANGEDPDCQVEVAIPEVCCSPKKSPVLELPLAPTRPQTWVPAFLDPEDAPSSDEEGSDIATNLFSNDADHSSTTSVGDELELASPNLAVKTAHTSSFPSRSEYAPTCVSLTVGSVSMLDSAAKEDGVECKERFARLRYPRPLRY